MPTTPATKVERKLIKLERVRLSYPNLFKPRAMKGDDGVEKDPEYSASFILDKKKHAAVIAQIEAEVKKIAIAKWGKVPVKFRSPLRDGSTFVDMETDEPKDGYGPDVYALNAKNKSKPQCVRRNLEPAEESDLYGGCYVNATISLWPWEHKANGKGVSVNLGPVQFVSNGEPFGAPQIKAEDQFEDLGEEDEGDDEPTPPKKTAKTGKKAAAADDDWDL